MSLLGTFVKRTKAAYRALTGSDGYEGGSRSRRLVSWRPDSSAPTDLVAGDIEIVRDRSREIVRRNCFASNALESYVSNCIGTGIRPRSKHPDKTTKKRLHEVFDRWSQQADADGQTDFYGIQALAVRTMFEAGEVIIRKRPRDLGEFDIPFQLQVLEPEHLPIEKNEDLPNGNRIRYGIEFDKNTNRRVAYWLHPEHPRSRFWTTSNESVRVPAENVIHMFRPLRPGQQRGMPWFHTVLVKLNELDQYDDAEVVRKKSAALLTFIIKELDPDNPVIGQGAGETADEDDDGTQVEQIAPGSTVKLLPGEDIEVPEAADVGGNYEAFMRVQLHAVAAGFGITYEQLTGDLAGVTYSSIRAGMLEFRRRCEQVQYHIVAHQLCRVVWGWFLQFAAIAGEIQRSDYVRNKLKYEAVIWRPQRWEWTDPEKDVKAMLLLIDNLLAARSQVQNEMGYDEDETDELIAEDQLREERLKLKRPVKQQLAVGGAAAENSNGSAK